jgi:PAS domain S-box-containing protein
MNKQPDILVVDDTPDNLRLLLRVLGNQGYSVRPVTQGAMAVAAAQLAPPDLILLDVQMPDMDGYEVCKQLKADSRTRHIPVIFLTVLDDTVDIVKGFDLGGVDYITKPVRTGELLVRIENQIQQQRLQRQLSKQNHALQSVLKQSKQTEIALRETEERFAKSFENSPLPLSLTSIPEGLYLDVNREYLWHTEYSREELLGQRSGAFNFWVQPKDEYRFYKLLKKQGRVDGFETRLRTKTGRICDVVLFLEVLYLSGEPYALIAAQDITLRLADERKLVARTKELSQALQTLQETQAQLIRSAKMAALGNMVAGVAHEINTPVGTAITTASTLENATRTLRADIAAGDLKKSSFENYLETAAECSQLILSNLQRAGELVQSFKQVAVDQSSVKARSLILKPYLQEVITNLTPTIKKTPHRITLVGSDDITLYSYPGAIAQIVTNLIINSLNHAYPACQTTEQTTEQATEQAGNLRITLHQQPGQVILQYSDDGCGISPAHQAQIFEPFFTTARELGGSGLGLHLVYNIVTQKLNGTINFASVPGNGTTFTITLPNTLSGTLTSSPQKAVL